MTYDPLSYGQVRLRDNADSAPNPNETPDDILFEDAGPGPIADQGLQTDWGTPDPDMDLTQAGPPSGQPAGFDPFGAEVLGESEPVPMAAPPSPVPAPAPMPQPAVSRPAPVAEEPAVEAPPPQREPMPRRSQAAQFNRPTRQPTRLMGKVMPAVVLAAGAGASTWFYMMLHNPVLAGITAAVTLVGTALSRMMFR